MREVLRYCSVTLSPGSTMKHVVCLAVGEMQLGFMVHDMTNSCRVIKPSTEQTCARFSAFERWSHDCTLLFDSACVLSISTTPQLPMFVSSVVGTMYTYMVHSVGTTGAPKNEKKHAKTE